MNDLINQVAAIAQLRKAATPGPWELVVKGNSIQSQAIAGVCSGISMKTGNGAFIAAVGGLDFDSIAAALAATPAAPLLQEAVAADLVALANRLDVMGESTKQDKAGRVSAADYIQLLVDSRAKLTAGIRALAVSSAGGGVPQAVRGVLTQMVTEFNAFEPASDVKDPQFRAGINHMRRYLQKWVEIALAEPAAPALPLLVEGAAAGQWVSVKERLPAEQGRVLVCQHDDDGPQVFSVRFTPEWHYDAENGGGQAGSHPAKFHDCRQSKVTHWQPIPQAPTNGN